ncbi:related to RNA helicase MSS116 [Phialocephala subalpina]|uniref:ATP-dependent RNA helicase n=1 Tax=Phialocephala subalpina TaxID=576137 RepID=A0A1L7X8M6_9HELO|nr:related to RNA helicase MSS116 [Phialocephala subalpina]
MDQSQRSPSRRHPYAGRGRGNGRGKGRGKSMTTNAAPRNNASSFPPPAFEASPASSAPPSRVATPPLTEAIPLDTPRFKDLEGVLSPVLIQTMIQDLKFDHMMPVQAATLHDLLKNRADVLAQAKTGTGKTVAFLLPAIQTMLNKRKSADKCISLLVISPTRELALQIQKEATKILQRLPEYKTCIAIGGTSKDKEERQILAGCDILIGTPGRLFDHLSDERIVWAFRNLDTLVLDEADRLLDMGFMPQLKKIIHCLPDKVKTKRQGMLFSATIAPHVKEVAHLILNKDYKFISTIQEGELGTHERVPQHLVVVPTFSDVAAAMVGSLRAEIKLEGKDTFKAIVFAPTAALVDFYGDILSALPDMPNVSVLHSRVSQSKRTSATNAYREAKNGILVATDVVARGMDFPNVTNVFQVGIPSDKESYIHRLGRTARAGAEGRGTFIVASPETFFSQWTLKEIAFENTEPDLNAKAEVLRIAEKMGDEKHAKVYQAWLGYYKNHTKGMKFDNARLVEEGNKFARGGLGAPENPGIKKSTVGKMGLKGVKGITVVPDPPRVGRGQGGGGEGRSAGSGGRGGRGGRTGGF